MEYLNFLSHVSVNQTEQWGLPETLLSVKPSCLFHENKHILLKHIKLINDVCHPEALPKPSVILCWPKLTDQGKCWLDLCYSKQRWGMAIMRTRKSSFKALTLKIFKSASRGPCSQNNLLLWTTQSVCLASQQFRTLLLNAYVPSYFRDCRPEPAWEEEMTHEWNIR